MTERNWIDADGNLDTSDCRDARMKVGDLILCEPFAVSTGRTGKDKEGYWRITDFYVPGRGAFDKSPLSSPPGAHMVKVLDRDGQPAKSKLPHYCSTYNGCRLMTAELAKEWYEEEIRKAKEKYENILAALPKP